MPKTIHIYGIYLCSSSAFIYVYLRLSNSFLYFKTISECPHQFTPETGGAKGLQTGTCPHWGLGFNG
jgi:hypothetical protein